MRTLDTEYVYFEIVDDILHATYKDGKTINLDAAKGIVETRLDFQGVQAIRVVVYIQGVVTIDKAARYYISSGDGVKGLIAAAIITDSPFAAVMGNFFASVNRPRIPIRLFTKPDKAVRWLKTKQVTKKQSGNG